MELTTKLVYESLERTRKVSKLILIISGTATLGLAASSEINYHLYNRENERAIASYYLSKDNTNHSNNVQEYFNNSNLLLKMAGGSAIFTSLVYAFGKWVEK